MTRVAASIVLAVLVLQSALVAQSRPPIVAAASDLTFALADVGRLFTDTTGERVQFVFGSSGTLARQVTDGAPFEIFLSADESFVEDLARRGLTRDAGRLYAEGRLVLFAPPGSPLDPRDGLEGLARLVAANRVSRFAIANPEHAPYGQAAEAALRRHCVWNALRPRLVLGENVSQAAQFALTGNATGGVLAYSLVLAPTLKGRGTWALIDAGLHPPLRQRMVLLRRAGPVATRFYDFLATPAATDVLGRYGFTQPR